MTIPLPNPEPASDTSPESRARPRRSGELPRYLATHLQGRDAEGLQGRIDDFRETIRQSGGRIVDIKWDDRPWATSRRAIVFYELERLRSW